MYLPPEALTAEEIHISDLDKSAFFELLKQNLGIEIYNLEERINAALQIEVDSRLKNLFKSTYNGDTDLWRIISNEYINLFGENRTYVNRVQKLFGCPNLENAIDERLRNLALERRVKEINEAIVDGGRSFSSNPLMEDFDLMNGIEFEQFLMVLFTTMGYRVKSTPNTGDFGADLLLS